MQFDEQFLQEMGLAEMPAEQKPQFLSYLQDELETRIGEQISEGVPEEKLQEFDSIEDAEAAAQWLEENRPDFRDVVERTVEAMKAEIKANRDQLLATSSDEPSANETPAEDVPHESSSSEVSSPKAPSVETSPEPTPVSPEVPYTPPESDLDLLPPADQPTIS